jgi:hypothetical protein
MAACILVVKDERNSNKLNGVRELIEKGIGCCTLA